MNKFKVGDKVMLREDSKWNNGNFNNPLNIVGVVVEPKKISGWFRVEWTNGTGNGYKEIDLDLVSDSIETYTDKELTYIVELEDRIEVLEDLCSDYSKEVDYWKAQYESAVNVSGTTLDLNNGEFKPVKDMTLEDWEQAKEEGWLFETLDRGNVKVTSLDPSNIVYGVRIDSGGRTWWVSLDGTDADEEGWTVMQRIK